MTRLARTCLTAALLASPFGLTAAAHHDWSWADPEQSELTGTVETIDMAAAHPQLTVAASDGTWTVDLGNPRQTQASGFTGDSIKAGDTVTALGNKASNGEKRIKAVRLTAGAAVFTFYPERIKE